jgi:2-keto-3-deoxy-L-rhamnonate aldolase RhmA
LSEKLERDEPAYGAFTVLGQPEVIELYGHVGMDFAAIDMMLGTVDWARAGAMTLAASRYDMAPIIRLPSYPWSGTANGMDPHVPAEVLRAISIGAEGVIVSLETADQVAAALEPRSNNHRRIYLPSFEFEVHGTLSERSTLEADEQMRDCLIMPLIESELALESLDDIFALPGLSAVFLGMGDLSEILGHPNDFRNPGLYDFIRDTVDRGKKHDVKVFVNIHGQATTEGVKEAADDLVELGAKGIFLPFDTGILVRFYTSLMAGIGTS